MVCTLHVEPPESALLIRSRQPDPLTASNLLPPEFAAELDGLDVRSRRVFAGKMQGERRSKRRGRSVEFDDFRPYVAGDDLRHIDWNVYARLDRFFIKLFQEEEDLSVHVVLDATASMLAGEPSKLRCASQIAAALSYVALANNNRLSLSAFDATGLHRLEPLRGRSNVQRAIAFTLAHYARPEQERTKGSFDFDQAMRQLAHSRQGRGVLVLLSDLLLPNGYEQGLKLLAGGDSANTGFQVCVFQVLAPGELDPATEGRTASNARGAISGDLRLLDSESSKAAEISVTRELLAAYRRRVMDYVARVKTFCNTRGIEHLMVSSDTAVPRFVLENLRKLGLVG